MEREGVQRKLTRVRLLRVRTSYDLQVGDAIELKELPPLLNAMGDSIDQSVKTLPKRNNGRFVHVNTDNFDSIFEKMRPRDSSVEIS